MNTYRIFLLLIGSMLFYQCGMMEVVREQEYHEPAIKPARSSSRHMPISQREPGACYAKCNIPEQFSESTYESYAIYTGSDSLNKSIIEEILIEINPSSEKWVKRKAPRGCQSPNPEDCMVWCLIEIPAQHLALRVLKDTTLSNEYEIQDIQFRGAVIKRGTVEWRKVLCKKDMPSNFIAELQKKLTIKGFYDGPRTTKIDKKLKKALTKFQEENNLPSGNLDFETLEALGL